jgi:hypothetical protein
VIYFCDAETGNETWNDVEEIVSAVWEIVSEIFCGAETVCSLRMHGCTLWLNVPNGCSWKRSLW